MGLGLVRLSQILTSAPRAARAPRPATNERREWFRSTIRRRMRGRREQGGETVIFTSPSLLFASASGHRLSSIERPAARLELTPWADSLRPPRAPCYRPSLELQHFYGALGGIVLRRLALRRESGMLSGRSAEQATASESQRLRSTRELPSTGSCASQAAGMHRLSCAARRSYKACAASHSGGKWLEACKRTCKRQLQVLCVPQPHR